MVLKQDIEFETEIIVVDSGSTDGTLELLKNNPVKLHEIVQKDFQFGLTRDYAFNLAKGKYIVTLSQDVIPADRTWLSNLVKPIISDSADVVQGATLPPIDSDVFYWERMGYFYFTREGFDFIQHHGKIGLSCSCLAIKKSTWEATRFGDVVFGEDKSIQKKIFLGGYRMMMSKDAIVFHGHQYSLGSLVKRCVNEGIGWRDVDVKYVISDLLKDYIISARLIVKLFRALQLRQIRNAAEIFFPVLRPICIYIGNHFR